MTSFQWKRSTFLLCSVFVLLAVATIDVEGKRAILDPGREGSLTTSAAKGLSLDDGVHGDALAGTDASKSLKISASSDPSKKELEPLHKVPSGPNPIDESPDLPNPCLTWHCSPHGHETPKMGFHSSPRTPVGPPSNEAAPHTPVPSAPKKLRSRSLWASLADE